MTTAIKAKARAASDSISLKEYLSRQRERVEASLERFLPREKAMPPSVHAAMRYSVFAGGKRLRPVLCLTAAEVCGGDWKKVLPTACALELIHTYSLVHDDLPAMDDDDFRRGMPTCHKQFGEAVAILAGDALLTQGFQVIAENALVPGVRPGAVVQVVRDVAQAAGSQGMIGGQIVDLEMEDGAGLKNRPKFHLDYIHRHKTGALIRASLKAGAVLAGAPAAQVHALDRYGEAIGLEFQIVDDILDVVGDKKLLGKRGSDRDNGKLTFPALYGLEASRRKARAEVQKAKDAAALFGARGRVLGDLADYILERQN